MNNDFTFQIKDIVQVWESVKLLGGGRGGGRETITVTQKQQCFQRAETSSAAVEGSCSSPSSLSLEWRTSAGPFVMLMAPLESDPAGRPVMRAWERGHMPARCHGRTGDRRARRAQLALTLTHGGGAGGAGRVGLGVPGSTLDTFFRSLAGQCGRGRWKESTVGMKLTMMMMVMIMMTTTVKVMLFQGNLCRLYVRYHPFNQLYSLHNGSVESTKKTLLF